MIFDTYELEPVKVGSKRDFPDMYISDTSYFPKMKAECLGCNPENGRFRVLWRKISLT